MYRKMYRQHSRYRRRGVVAVQVAVMGTVIIGFAALTIDVSVMYNARGELQRTADAAALAAASRLAAFEAAGEQGSSVEGLAREAAVQYTLSNDVLGRSLALAAEDVTFGRAVYDVDAGAYTFSPVGSNPDAVRVVVRETDDSPNQALPLYFAAIFGKHSANVSAEAIAMLVPRDIAVVADLSGSHNDDSELRHYKTTHINMLEMWQGLPIESGTWGVGDGRGALAPGDPDNPPPSPPVGPGHPGYVDINILGRTGPPDGGDPAGDSEFEFMSSSSEDNVGPTWGWMHYWGDELDPDTYDPATDPGLIHLPRYQDWSDGDLVSWYQGVGYNDEEIAALMSSGYDGSRDSNGQYAWTNRVAVALGLARWDSGVSGGLWESIPEDQRQVGNGNDWPSAGELTWLVDYPFASGSWNDFIYGYLKSSSTQLYRTDHDFQYRFGLKTFLNYLLERKYKHSQTAELAQAPAQPMQAVKDAVQQLVLTVDGLESQDQLSLEIYGTRGRHEVDLTTSYSDVSNRLSAMQAGYYDAWTNMGAGILRGIEELNSDRSNPVARKVIFLLTDGYANVASEYGSGGDYDGGKEYARSMAHEAADQGIQVFAVTVGSYSDTSLMDEIADIGHGEHLNASGATIAEMSQQLSQIFEHLGGRRPVELIK